MLKQVFNRLIKGRLSRNKILSVVVLALGLTLSLVTALSGPPTSPPTFPAQRQGVVATQHVVFTIYPEGILPSKVNVHKGVISISIEDLAGANGGVLIDRVDDGGRRSTVGNVQRFDRHWRGHGLVELSPGVYELRVAGKPANEAQLIVEP